MHILIVTHFYPPLNAIASLRPFSFAKYFVEQGHRVTVLTTAKIMYDGNLDLEGYDHPLLKVIEIPYTPLFFWKKQIQGSQLKQVLKDGKPQIINRGVSYRLKKVLKTVVDSLGFMLDHQRFWTSKAVREADLIIAAQSVDIMLSTFSPAAAHIAAGKIAVRHPKLKWIADYRDLWSQNHILSAKWLFKPLERFIEKRTIAKADYITTVSAPLAEDLCRFVRNRVPVSIIYNGYEGSHLRNLPASALHIQKPLSIVYTGTIYKGRRDPSPLLIALNDLEAEGIIKEGDIKVEFYGNANDNLMSIVQLCGGEKWITIKGYVPYKEAIRVQQKADFLLFLESNKKDARGVLTGKLFEYLIANKPILGVGIDEQCATGQLIEATRTGLVFGEDKDKIKRYLRLVLTKGEVIHFNPDWKEINQYSRDAQSRKMLTILTNMNNAAG